MSPIVGRKIPHGAVDIFVGVFAGLRSHHACVFGLCTVLLFQCRFWYSVYESCTYYTDCGFYAYGDVFRLRVSVERAFRDFYLRIDEFVFLAVRKLHWQSAFHGRHLMPFHVNLILIHWRQEW